MIAAPTGTTSSAQASRRDFGVRGLPDFPWDTIAAAKATAAAHPDGIIDLSVGTPVDPTPTVIAEALSAAANAPGYPTTTGSVELRTSIADYLVRTASSIPLRPDQVLPTIGSKELVAWLPTLLGLGSDDVVVIPELAYPTYAVGAHLAGCPVVTSDAPWTIPVWPAGAAPALLWVNSPANPTGRIDDVATMARAVAWARERGVVIASDECYLPFGWDAEPVSVLDPRVNGGSSDGVLAVHSLSKRSNVAGYRAGFVAGDAGVVDALLAVRKHAGMLVPQPVQAALAAAVADDAHADEQVERYRARRDRLAPAFVRAGFRIDDSQGALYLWVTLGEPCRDTVDRLSALGILAAPGDFYGAAGDRHVRVALTATDERIAAAATRLDSAGPLVGPMRLEDL